MRSMKSMNRAESVPAVAGTQAGGWLKVVLLIGAGG